jgi:hypothetical protein
MSDPRIRARIIGTVVDGLCVGISAFACDHGSCDVIALVALHGDCNDCIRFSRKPCLQATSKYIFLMNVHYLKWNGAGVFFSRFLGSRSSKYCTD